MERSGGSFNERGFRVVTGLFEVPYTENSEPFFLSLKRVPYPEPTPSPWEVVVP